MGVARVGGSWSNLLCHHVITCAIHGWYHIRVNRSTALLSPTALRAWRPLRHLAVHCPGGEKGPENARILVRQRHGGDLGAAARPELLQPDTPGVLFALHTSDDGDGALEEQPAQILKWLRVLRIGLTSYSI